MFQKFLARIFKRRTLPSADTQPKPSAETAILTGKDFEFLITPGDLEIPASDFDELMTPDSFSWTKVMKNNWAYYQVEGYEYSYSWEPPGIQMTFNKDMPYPKAKIIADEVVGKLAVYTGRSIELMFISGDVPLRFDNLLPSSAATFRIKSAFQLTGRSFFLLGDILSGKIKKGMMIDLGPVGIDKKFVLEAIEFALHREGGAVWEDIGLGISNLTEEEKELLKTGSPFSNQVTIA